ncbi:ATP-binding protein [Kitasatospora sp. NPDC127111]|uniref:ATP-binding protein n=1 Tax=Kitasatospora sp. NPDC127111 TaxID=3345363 RepID=UPI0036436843
MHNVITSFTTPATHACVGGVRNKLLRELSGLPLTPDQLDTMRLAASEVVTNALTHGVGREDASQDLRVEVTVDRASSRLRVTVINPCRTRQIPATRSTAATDSNAESGRGLFIVETITDEIGSEVLAGDDGKLLRAVWFELNVTLPASSSLAASTADQDVHRPHDVLSARRETSVQRAAGCLVRLPRRINARRWPPPWQPLTGGPPEPSGQSGLQTAGAAPRVRWGRGSRAPATSTAHP